MHFGPIPKKIAVLYKPNQCIDTRDGIGQISNDEIMVMNLFTTMSILNVVFPWKV